MNEVIEKLAQKTGEGYQASTIGIAGRQTNLFFRPVTVRETSDLSFITGLAATGLRSSAYIDSHHLTANYSQLLAAARQHLPLVVNTSARLTGSGNTACQNNFANVRGVAESGFFQLVAHSLQEEIHLTLIAQRVAELALVPGMVIADYPATAAEYCIPADKLMVDYLGNPDDPIPSPTPAQEMLFGKFRRRVPNWFTLDLPAMLGAAKDGEAIAFEAAASQKYFYDHLPALIDQAFAEFNQLLGTETAPLKTKNEAASHLLISAGGRVPAAFAEHAAKDTGLISLVLLNPLPAALAGILQKKPAVTLLEYVAGPGHERSTLYHFIRHHLGNSNNFYYAQHGEKLTAGALEKAIARMKAGEAEKEYYLGIDFTKPGSNYPAHEILLQEIAKQYPQLKQISLGEDEGPRVAATANTTPALPLAVRAYQDRGPAYTRLARFYHNTAFFYQHHEPHELVADPFAALPVTPAASANFFTPASQRDALPVFLPQNCTGCGDCFVHCPHAALPPVALNVTQLVTAGISLAIAKGKLITKLTPMVKNLARVAGKTISETQVTRVSDFLPAAFASLATQMKLAGDKLAAVQDEFTAVAAELASLPVAVTEKLFTTPNAIEAGSGELFSLAVNPSACTGCGLCAEICPEEALTMMPQETATLDRATHLFRLWEQLPDTAGDTIARLLHDKEYNGLAALMLSRNYYMTMSGASGSGFNSPYKTLLHIVTVTTEAVIQPKIIKQVQQINELITALSENIHTRLSKALPKENLHNLAEALQEGSKDKISLREVVSKLATQGSLLEVEPLSRKAALIDALKNLQWALAEGPTGVGRARYGLLLAGASSLTWARQYPVNNFTTPVVIHWQGSAPEKTLGLFYGHLRHLLDNFKILRRAALEARDKYDPAVHDPAIAGLTWQDLSEEERLAMPPILLIAEREDLNEAGWGSLHNLLAEEYPLKVVIFDHIASPAKNPQAHLQQTTSALISAIALKNTFVYQGGFHAINHLFNGLYEGLGSTGPALFNIYANKAAYHTGHALNWRPYAALAANSRTFPALRYHPGQKDYLIGTIDLTGNESYRQDWVAEEVSITEGQTLDYRITWADWAFTQQDWQAEFNEVAEARANLPVAEYIALPAANREGKIPVIMRAGSTGLKYYALSHKVVAMTELVLANWRTWQELAGLLTEFPAKLKQEVTRELEEKYAREAAVLKQQYEQALAGKEAAQTEILRQRLKEKLVTLAKMAKR